MLLFWSLSVFSQDIHFSQFNFSPLNLNPANAGLFNGDARFVVNYRNQWFNVPVNFNTISASFDAPVFTLKNHDKIGAGALFYYDRVGDSRFTSVQFMLSLSYILNFGKDDKHSISAGLNFGVGNRSFQYQYLYFDNQFNGDHYVPNMSSGESFPNTGISYPDVGLGVAYQYQLNERKYITVGFSTLHVNAPKQNFFIDNTSFLNPRFTINARARWKVLPKLDVVPELLFQNQDTKNEFAFGLHTKAFVFKQKNAQICLNTGVYYRSNDALYVLVGMDYNSWQINLSYDINTSRFGPATNSYGGIEASVIYILAKVKKVPSAGSSCPVL
ncbi:MAG TPA: PorP/SprF family type IX secretion system membrane protein, partial [Chitinophagales bacterium]